MQPDSRVAQFLKLARATHVESHSRRVGNKVVQVAGHNRDVDDAEVDPEVARVAALRIRQGKEIALWQTWKDGGEKPKDLGPLLKSFAPLIQNKASTHLGKVRLVPDAAIRAEYQLQFVAALRAYDPTKGVALGTYVYRYLDKAKRYIAEHQNVGRIPENRIYRIKEFTTAQENLLESLDRAPTDDELAEELGWTKADAKRMSAELRSDLISQGFEEDPFQLIPSKEEEVLRLFKYELTGIDQEVYAYLTGYGRPKTPNTGEIAKKMKLPDYQVSRIKLSLQKKMKRYLESGY